MAKKLCDMTEDEREESRRRHRENYLLNREKRIEQAKASQRNRWAADPEGMRKKYRKWGKTQREKMTLEQRRAQANRYYHAHRDRILVRQKSYYETHKDQMQEAGRRYAKKNPHVARAAMKRYYLKNRERILAHSRFVYRKAALEKKLKALLQNMAHCRQLVHELEQLQTQFRFDGR